MKKYKGIADGKELYIIAENALIALDILGKIYPGNNLVIKAA